MDHHFVHLARTLGIGDFYNFFFHLGMSKADYDNLNFCYFANPMNFMLMGLFQWRDREESGQSSATFGKLLTALTAIDRQHYLCQVRLIILFLTGFSERNMWLKPCEMQLKTHIKSLTNVFFIYNIALLVTKYSNINNFYLYCSTVQFLDECGNVVSLFLCISVKYHQFKLRLIWA